MSNVFIITGCTGSAGLKAARLADKDNILVITGKTVEELEDVKAALKAEGREIHTFAADPSVKKEAHAVFAQANLLGTIKTVIHIPEPLPETAEIETIIRTHMIGTKNVNMEARKYMNEGGSIVDFAFEKSAQIPDILIKPQIFEKAEYEEDVFLTHMTREPNMAVGIDNKTTFAYALSTTFIEWYAQKCAEEYAAQGINVVCEEMRV